MVQRSDVIVAGLGGLGSSAAYQLARAGLKVTGLERFHRVHARGASHGESRGVWQAYFMGPSYVPYVQRAVAMWEELSAELGQTFFHRTGGICLGSPEATLVPAALASAQSCGLTHEYLSADDVRRRFPVFTPTDDEVAIYDPSAGYVRPEVVVGANLQLAERAGAQLHFEEQILDVTFLADGVRVRTAQDTYEADRIVLSAGCWTNDLIPELQLPITVLRKTMAWFDPTEAPENYLPGRMPYWIWERAGAVGYGHPAVDGSTGGVKAGIHSGGEPTHPDEIDGLVRADELEVLRDFLRDALPSLPGRLLRSRVCMYDNTPDMGFVIGQVPGNERAIIAAGTSGHAFKFVPAIGESITELVLGKTPTQDLSRFAPDRFASTGLPAQGGTTR
jgi:sarcosine oxidase